MTSAEKDVVIKGLKSEIASLDLVLVDTEKRCDDLEYELEAEPAQEFCRRCFKPFPSTNGRRYCSRDCELFAPQQPFDVLYKQLHPQWPEKRGTASTLLA